MQTRRRCARALGLGLLVLGAGCGDAPEEQSAQRNLLLITLDTTRADALSCLGGRADVTPHLDRLAERSLLFAEARSETNVTNPSHLTLMTGLPAISHGVFGNKSPVPDGLDTLPEALARTGMQTAAFVSTRHLGEDFGWRGWGAFHNAATSSPPVSVTSAALAWLEKHAGDPFFVWVHYFNPHILYNPPPELRKRFYPGDPEAGDGPPLAAHPYFKNRKTVIQKVRRWLGSARDPEYPRAMYAAEIHHVDREIGRILAVLEALGIDDRTIIVVAGDHGESLGEHDLFYTHAGLFEQQLRVPLIVLVPGQRAHRELRPVSTLDVLPTVADLLGVELAHRLPGISLAPLAAGLECPELDARDVFVHQHANNSAVAVRKGDWKLIWPLEPGIETLSALPQLFHLSEDPGELVDRSSSQPEKLAELRKIIEPWIQLEPASEADNSHLDAAALEELRALGYGE